MSGDTINYLEAEIEQLMDENARLRMQLAIQYGMHPGGDLAKASKEKMEELEAEIERLRKIIRNILEGRENAWSGARRALEGK
jgi:archaellum component FlaC